MQACRHAGVNACVEVSTVVKTQVQLPEEDLAVLRRLAAEERVSVSELVRRAVAQLLSARRSPTREELWERARRVVGKYRSKERDIAQRHDDYLAEDFAR
jgi:Arc/MetJ-type ribon-helix-helix transcriptional regulator